MLHSEMVSRGSGFTMAKIHLIHDGNQRSLNLILTRLRDEWADCVIDASSETINWAENAFVCTGITLMNGALSLMSNLLVNVSDCVSDLFESEMRRLLLRSAGIKASEMIRS